MKCPVPLRFSIKFKEILFHTREHFIMQHILQCNTERNGAEREEEIEIELKRKRFSISLHAQTERNGMGTRSGVERWGNVPIFVKDKVGTGKE